MYIVNPPGTSNNDFNLVKQRIVTELCYRDALDDMLLPVQDCQMLEQVHHPDLLWRARQSGVDGFGGLDYRKVMHAEASAQCMVEAVAKVLKFKQTHRQPIAFAPVSGFHHAGYNRNGGFCTFNGLIAAALQAKSMGAMHVLILDGDAHWGNGTAELIDQLKLDWIWHMHVGDVKAWQGQRHGMDLSAFDLVLYQAGVDCHLDDPCGIGTYTTGDLISRDRQIFMMAAEYSVPIVWNLAGGYGIKSIDLHTSTFQTACEVYESDKVRPLIQRAASMDWSWVDFPMGRGHLDGDPAPSSATAD